MNNLMERNRSMPTLLLPPSLGIITKKKKTKITDDDLPFTQLKEKKPLLNRVSFMPKNTQALVQKYIIDHNQFLKTFSSPFDMT